MKAFDLSDPTLLFQPGVLADPTELYATLRARAPVWEIPGTATYVVTSAVLIGEAVARPDDFSSNLTSLLYTGPDGHPAVFDMTPLGDGTHVLATADPPVHTRHRKLVAPLLTPARVGRLEAFVRATTDELLNGVLGAGKGDLVAALCDPLPVRVICRVMGVPESDTDRLVRLVLEMNAVLSGVTDAEGMDRATVAALETGAYLAEHLERARSTRAADDTLLAVLAGAVDAGAVDAGAVDAGEVTFDEAVGMLLQMLSAGTDTTTSLIGRGARFLAEHDDVQDQLRDDPARIPTFVEEILRVDGPFRFHYRAARHDTELGGVRIPAGARLMLMWAAANLDEVTAPDPARVDLDRTGKKSHFAFGRGIHFCIGAPLARLEARVALEQLLVRTTQIRLDPDHPPRYRPTIFLRRLADLDVLFGTA